MKSRETQRKARAITCEIEGSITEHSAWNLMKIEKYRGGRSTEEEWRGEVRRSGGESGEEEWVREEYLGRVGREWWGGAHRKSGKRIVKRSLGEVG